MVSRFHLFAAALAGVLACSLAGAQARNGVSHDRQPPVHVRSAMRAPAALTPTAAASGFQSVQQASVIRISPSGEITSGFNPIMSTISFDGVSGLGFDFPHLAAISGALRNNGSSHFGHNGHHGQEAFVPILFGGYPYYYDDSGYGQTEQQAIQPSQPQPQIIVIQQPVPMPQAADSGSDAGNASSSLTAAIPQGVPVRDVGDFILVRRDGRVLFASAFSVVGTQLQYVTPEGIRRTLAMTDLDADATQQMNEARGTTVQIHNGPA